MHDIGLLRDLLLLVGLAIPVVALAHRLSAPPLVGFLAVGVLVGPFGLGLIDNSGDIEVLAEFGVALLLFAVGLELSLSHVRRWARTVFVGGSLQVGTTLALVAALGWIAGIPGRSALFYGGLAALSSTAVVSKAYADRGELDTPHGRSVISVLLFQDLCILPLMLGLPLLSGAPDTPASSIVTSLVRGLALMTALVVGGRWLVKWTLDRVVLLRDRELFTLCVGFFGIGAALVTSEAGFSIAIGAFIAGLIISESEYGLQAMSDVLPFRALFSGIFFASIGMLLDLNEVITQLPLMLGVTLLLMVLKLGCVAATVRVAGAGPTTAIISGLSLAQVGEFSFLFAALGLPLGLFRDGDYQVFLTAAVLSMMLTPFLIHVARPVSEHVAARLGWLGVSRREARTPLDTVRDHTIIVGYGLAGRYLARELQAAAVPCLVVEQNAELVERARDEGVNVVFGDATRHAVLEHVRLAEARVIVFAISSPTDERRGVALARDMSSTVRIVVRTRYVRAIDELFELGATDVVVEEFEASLELFAKALAGYEIPVNRIWRELQSVRTEHYGLLRGHSTPELRLDALKHLGIHDALELVEVEPDAEAVGLSARALDLRRRTGAVQIAVVRDGRPIFRKDLDFQYEVGDTVVLVGEPESLQAAMAMYRRPPGSGTSP